MQAFLVWPLTTLLGVAVLAVAVYLALRERPRHQYYIKSRKRLDIADSVESSVTGELTQIGNRLISTLASMDRQMAELGSVLKGLTNEVRSVQRAASKLQTVVSTLANATAKSGAGSANSGPALREVITAPTQEMQLATTDAGEFSDSLLENVCNQLLEQLETEGNGSEAASTEGLKNWLKSKAPLFAVEIWRESGTSWLLSVVYRPEGHGRVLPAIDVPLGLGLNLSRWFDYNHSDYSPTVPLSKRFIQELPVVERARDRGDSAEDAWTVTKKGRISVVSAGKIASVLVGLAVVALSGRCWAQTVTPPVMLPSQLQKTARVARVYFDVSASMKGFSPPKKDQQRPQPDLRALVLEQLRPILVSSGIDSFQVATVAEETTLKGDVNSFEDFSSPSVYNGQETYLSGAIDNAGEEADDDVILVLTDGVVSLREARPIRGTPSATAGCSKGNDITCAALSIRSYVSNGHGFWIVGLKLPFYGPYYVEQGGIHLQRGRAIRKGPFPNHPFYIWIGSPSVSQGRNVAEALIEFARAHGLDYLASEVAPGTWEGWAIDGNATSRDLTAASPEYCRPGDLLGELTRAPGNGPLIIHAHEPPHSFFRRISSATSLGFQLPVTPAFGEIPPSIPGFFDYTESVSSLEKGVSVRTQVSSGKESAGKTEACLTFNGALQSDRAGKTIHLVSDWKQTAIPYFWDAWSTENDDTLDSVGKTVNLDEFFRVLRRRLSVPDGTPVAAELPLVDISYPSKE